MWFEFVANCFDARCNLMRGVKWKIMAQAPQDRPSRKREAGTRNVLSLLQTQCGVSKVLASADDLQAALPSIIASVCINLGWELGAFWQYATTRPVLMCTNISAAD